MRRTKRFLSSCSAAFLLILFLPVATYATPVLYSVTGTGAFFQSYDEPLQFLEINGSMIIDDSPLTGPYDVDYSVKGFTLSVGKDYYFTGAGGGMLLYDAFGGGYVGGEVQWGLTGTGDWTRWSGDHLGHIFYYADGSPYDFTDDFTILAPLIYLASMDMGTGEAEPDNIYFPDGPYGDYGLWLTRVTNGAAPVPEPATMLLLGSGLLGLAGLRRRFRS